MEERYDQLLNIAEQHQPTGIRFIYYTATTTGIVPKTPSGYVKVQRAILQSGGAHNVSSLNPCGTNSSD